MSMYDVYHIMLALVRPELFGTHAGSVESRSSSSSNQAEIHSWLSSQ